MSGQVYDPNSSTRYFNVWRSLLHYKNLMPSEQGYTIIKYKDKDGQDASKTGLFYKNFTGIINGIALKEVEFSDNRKVLMLNIKMSSSDTGEEIIISMPLKGDHARSFIERALYIEPLQKLTLKPYYYENTGNTGISITQNDKKFDSYFKHPYVKGEHRKIKKETGYPDPADFSISDSDDWKDYYSAIDRFLKKILIHQIIPKFDVAKPHDTTSPHSFHSETPSSSKPTDQNWPQEEDDLPF